jgi:hypothetical protein
MRYALLALLLAAPLAGAAEKGPWPAPVPGWKAPQAGEHPRLFFRKGDVAGLRRRAQTPEGQVMVKRLRMLLDGKDGKTLPEIVPTPGQGARDAAPGTALTMFHPAGYGMLYHLTDDRQYADLGRQAMELVLTRAGDIGPRYGFVRPNGALRAGPSLGAVAMGYDLCYDGWDGAFRERVAKAIEKGPGGIASDTALIPAIQAWRVAGGQDFVSPRPNVAAITMLKVHELLLVGGEPWYPIPVPSGYGSGYFGPVAKGGLPSDRDGLSRGGQFAQGFGAVPDQLKPAALAGTVPMDFGSVIIPIGLDLRVGDDGKVTGAWTRRVPAGMVVKRTGTLTATPPDPNRIFPTPWLKDQPVTSYGPNLKGTTTMALTLAGAGPGDRPENVVIRLDWDGTKVVRAAAGPGPRQSWHQVDASAIKVLSGDRIEGDLVVVLNPDKWLHRREVCPGLAGRIHVAAERKGDGLTGTWTATWGEPYTFTGTVTGVRKVGPDAN